MIKSILKIKKQKKLRRHTRIRAKISGTALKPRLVVFRSHRHTYAQLIDDRQGKTLASVSDLEIKNKVKKSEKARLAGELLVEKAKKLKIKKAVFDRAGYKYHGRVKSLAEGARQAGLIF